MKNKMGLLLPAVITLSLLSCASRQSTTGMNASTAANPVALSGNGTSVIPVENINTNTTGNSLIRTSGTTSTAANATAPGMATVNSTGSYTMDMADADNAAIARNKAIQFMQESNQISSSAITLSDLAKENTQRTDVKAFASMVIQDHNELVTELKELATAKKVSLSASNTNAEVSAAVRDKAEKLRHTPNNQFDRTYIELMVKDYKRTIALFEHGTKSSDRSIKTFTIKHLPALKLHLQQAVALGKK